MKKAIALLITLVLTLSLGSMFAFADAGTGIAGTAGEAGTGMAGTAGEAGTGSDVYFVPETGVGETNPPIGRAFALTTTDATGATYVLADVDDLILVDTKNQRIVGADNVLTPNETYKFDIYHVLAAGASTTAGTLRTDVDIIKGSELLRKDMVGTGSVKFTTVKGSSQSIASVKVKTTTSAAKGSYYVEIVTKANYGTKLTDVEYRLTATSAGVTTPLSYTGINTFKVGFMNDENLDTDIGEEGTIIIDRTLPVIMKDQFTDIAKSANYKNVIFEGEDGNWSFTGKVAGMKDTNFYYDYDPDTDILNRFPEHDFKFLNFRSGVSFPTTGTMRIDISDVNINNGRVYAYLYREGKLTEIAGTYDNLSDEIVFRTNYLGKFIITLSLIHI